MGIFEATLILATLLCSLVAGFLFAYAIVVMPGMGSLSDREFIRAFQVTDCIIQDNQPVFILVWIGSAVALICSAAFGIARLDGFGVLLICFITLAYLLGVQLPTIAINVPLNNKLQTLDVDAMNDAALKTAREDFESRWNRWNIVRTAISCLVSALLMLMLLWL